MPKLENFYAFKIGAIWASFRRQHMSFWFVSAYLFFEYVRPQSIIPSIDVLPWTQSLLLLSIASIFLDPSCKFVNSKVNKWLLIYTVLILLSWVFAYAPAYSERNFVTFIQWIIIFFIITTIVNTKERFYIFLLIFCFASFKLSLFGAKTWAERGFSFTSWGIRGPPGYFTNSGELSVQMLVFFPLGYYIYLSIRDNANVKRWEKFLLIGFSVTAAMTVLGASSRGSQLALFVQLLVLCGTKVLRPKVLIVGAAIVFLIVTYLPEEQKARFESAGEDQTSVQRLLYWENGWEMMKEYPFLGVGYWNFVPYYTDHYPEDMLYEHAELPHNIFIQVGTDAGFPALIVYIILISHALFLPRRLRRLSKKTGVELEPIEINLAKALSVGILGFVVAGQFVTIGYYPFLWIGIAMVTAWEAIVRGRCVTNGETSQRQSVIW